MQICISNQPCTVIFNAHTLKYTITDSDSVLFNVTLLIFLMKHYELHTSFKNHHHQHLKRHSSASLRTFPWHLRRNASPLVWTCQWRSLQRRLVRFWHSAIRLILPLLLGTPPEAGLAANVVTNVFINAKQERRSVTNYWEYQFTSKKTTR